MCSLLVEWHWYWSNMNNLKELARAVAPSEREVLSAYTKGDTKQHSRGNVHGSSTLFFHKRQQQTRYKNWSIKAVPAIRKHSRLHLDRRPGSTKLTGIIIVLLRTHCISRQKVHQGRIGVKFEPPGLSERIRTNFGAVLTLLFTPLLAWLCAAGDTSALYILRKPCMGARISPAARMHGGEGITF
jgi:hypothetical protein